MDPESFVEASGKANGMIATYEETKPKLAKYLMDNLYDRLIYLDFLKRYHRKIH